MKCKLTRLSGRWLGRFTVSASSTFWRIKVLPSDSARFALFEALMKEIKVNVHVEWP